MFVAIVWGMRVIFLFWLNEALFRNIYRGGWLGGNVLDLYSEGVRGTWVGFRLPQPPKTILGSGAYSISTISVEILPNSFSTNRPVIGCQPPAYCVLKRDTKLTNMSVTVLTYCSKIQASYSQPGGSSGTDLTRWELLRSSGLLSQWS
jgi:hypothetical protein